MARVWAIQNCIEVVVGLLGCQVCRFQLDRIAPLGLIPYGFQVAHNSLPAILGYVALYSDWVANGIDSLGCEGWFDCRWAGKRFCLMDHRP